MITLLLFEGTEAHERKNFPEDNCFEKQLGGVSGSTPSLGKLHTLRLLPRPFWGQKTPSRVRSV